MEDGRKKLNTVFHYQVCIGVCVCVRPLWWVYLYIPDIATATAGVLKVRTPCKWCHWLSMGGGTVSVATQLVVGASVCVAVYCCTMFLFMIALHR